MRNNNTPKHNIDSKIARDLLDSILNFNATFKDQYFIYGIKLLTFSLSSLIDYLSPDEKLIIKSIIKDLMELDSQSLPDNIIEKINKLLSPYTISETENQDPVDIQAQQNEAIYKLQSETQIKANSSTESNGSVGNSETPEQIFEKLQRTLKEIYYNIPKVSEFISQSTENQKIISKALTNLGTYFFNINDEADHKSEPREFSIEDLCEYAEYISENYTASLNKFNSLFGKALHISTKSESSEKYTQIYLKYIKAYENLLECYAEIQNFTIFLEVLNLHGEVKENTNFQVKKFTSITELVNFEKITEQNLRYLLITDHGFSDPEIENFKKRIMMVVAHISNSKENLDKIRKSTKFSPEVFRSFTTSYFTVLIQKAKEIAILN